MLLEMLIALALLSGCLIPLLQPCLALYHERQKHLCALTYASFEREAVAALKEQLYLQNYPLDTLQKGISFPLIEGQCNVLLCAVETTNRETLLRTGILLKATFTPQQTFHPPFSRLIFVEGVLS